MFLDSMESPLSIEYIHIYLGYIGTQILGVIGLLCEKERRREEEGEEEERYGF